MRTKRTTATIEDDSTPDPCSLLTDSLLDKGFAYRQLNFKNYVHSEGEPFHNFLRSAAVSLSWHRPGHRSVFETQFLANSWSPGGREHREQIPSLDLLLDWAVGGHRTMVSDS